MILNLHHRENTALSMLSVQAEQSAWHIRDSESRVIHVPIGRNSSNVGKYVARRERDGGQCIARVWTITAAGSPLPWKTGIACTWAYEMYTVSGNRVDLISDGGELAPAGAKSKPGEKFIFTWSPYLERSDAADRPGAP
jgi:hypothetical protein